MSEEHEIARIEEEMGAASAGGAPTNSAGNGAVDGIGVGSKGEPGVNRKDRHRKKAKVVVMDMLKRKMGEKKT